MIVHFFVDPACPWAWITSRWLCEVAPHRDLSVRWRTFSLERRDDGHQSEHIPEVFREAALGGRELSRRAVRVFEAVRATTGEEAVGDLYGALGSRIFVPGAPPSSPAPDVLHEALVSAGLDPVLEKGGDQSGWDRAVEASMEEALAAVGPEVMVPTIVVEAGERRGLCGPVLSTAPTGETAVRLWDAFVELLRQPSFHELRRSRQFPEFPVARG